MTVALVPVNPLVAYDVLAVIGVLVCVAILRDRPRTPTPRIVGAYRDVTIDVPALERPAWLDQVDDTETWTYRAGNPRPFRRPRAYNEIGRAVFPDPPAPRFVRQPRVGLDGQVAATTTVARAFDEWPDHRTGWHVTVPRVVVLPRIYPDQPIEIEQAA